MRNLFKVLTLLAIACLSMSLVAIDGGYFSAKPVFDPNPRVNPVPANRETVLNSITYEGWEDGWVFSMKFEAVFDNLGRITYVKGFDEIDQGQGVYNYRLLTEYRPDYWPLHMTFQYREGEEWIEFGDVEYSYENDLLQWYVVSGYQYHPDEPVYGPVLQVAFIYAQTTNLLESVVEYSNFTGPIPYLITKYDYVWDAGLRPTEIIESVLGINKSWDASTRTTYVYHNDDQTSHAAYLRSLAFDVPYFPGTLVTGIQASKLLEKRTYLPNGSNWIENVREFYIYNEDSQLQRIDSYNNYANTLGWQVRQQLHYAYQDGYPISETNNSYDYVTETMLPSYRITYGYTELTEANDPVTPALIRSLKVFPNPCNPQAGISYKLEAAGQAEISVYNLKGQKVRNLIDAPVSAGNHTITWDGRDDRGNSLSSGIYMIRLRSGAEARSVKVVLVK